MLHGTFALFISLLVNGFISYDVLYTWIFVPEKV